MKRSKFRIGTLVLFSLMAVNVMMPSSMNGQGGGADGFFKGGSSDYETRDADFEMSGGITNDSFDAPLGGGLLVMAAAGIVYAFRKRRGAISMSLLLILGMTQCKKTEQEIIPYNNKVMTISLFVDNDKSNVNPATGSVDFVEGDEIIVANHGVFVGRLTYDGDVFSGTIANPDENDYLHFYHLGNQDVGAVVAGVSTMCSVLITDQIAGPTVISAGSSTVHYSPDVTSYTARLHNKCALVKFDVSTSSNYAAICVKGFKNRVNIDFTDDMFTFSEVDEGKICLPSGNGEKWAVLLPQESLEAGATGTAFAGRFEGTRGAVPEITVNAVLDAGVTVSIHEPMLPEGALNMKALFKVGAEEDAPKVLFSKSNLAYTLATGELHFQDHQYSCVEPNQHNVGENYYYDEEASLFGWGTSGINHGAVNYMPNITERHLNKYNAYGNPAMNLCDSDGRADWGYNKIKGGGETYKQWRSLTWQEWKYLLHDRPGADDMYGYASIAASAGNDIIGCILLPDDFVDPYANSAEYSFKPGRNNGFGTNTYTLERWANMEANGAVFLPASGRRYKLSCQAVNIGMFIWTSTVANDTQAYSIFIGDEFDYSRVIYKYYGCVARLVCD